MKRKLLLLIFIGFSLMSYAQIEFISPEPESKYNNPETSILIRFHEAVDSLTINDKSFCIRGSLGENYRFSYKIKNDQKTIILNPEVDFIHRESVNVIINDKIKTQNGISINPFTYSFTISDNTLKRTYSESLDKNNISDSYPNFPSITINKNDNPAEGKIFFHNISALESAKDRYIAIIENNGTPVYAKQDNKRGLGFTLQKNGYITYWNNKNFYMVDSNYAVIDSFACGNGYDADWHEFQITNNGHAFLISWDIQTINMSLIVPGGQEYATVEGLIIQELDESKDVIFQWRSWDHFNIMDAVDVDFTASYVSYNHGNAIEIDSDTTLLISSRLMNEVTKINRKTGEIIWRLGGKNNEFTFIGDEGFCRQHDIRRLPNGNITLFDNGSCHVPQISAAKEYSLDETNKTATLVWKYEHPTKMYCETMGSVQRLKNGNTFINWGRLPDTGMTGENLLPAITEVRQDKSIAFELTFNTFFHMAYRSYRFDWNGNTQTGTGFIDHISKDIEFEIYPNPAKNLFYIEFENSISGAIDITITNLSGMIITEIRNVKTFEGKNTITIDGSKLNTGLYYCTLFYANKSISKKVLVIH